MDLQPLCPALVRDQGEESGPCTFSLLHGMGSNLRLRNQVCFLLFLNATVSPFCRLSWRDPGNQAWWKRKVGVGGTESETRSERLRSCRSPPSCFRNASKLAFLLLPSCSPSSDCVEATRISSFFRMSLWLPRPAPRSLVTRISNTHSHILHPRIILTHRYSQHTSLQPLSSLRFQSTDSSRNASISSSSPSAEPKPTPTPSPPQPKDVSTAVQAPLATRVWKKVKHEAAHYWAGSKLLVSEVRISARLQWKILHGESLTRRERRQVRTLVVACSTLADLSRVLA